MLVFEKIESERLQFGYLRKQSKVRPRRLICLSTEIFRWLKV